MLIVFGGSFNPPTIAHYEIAEYLSEQTFCEQFIFLPVGNQYPKKGLVESFHRVKMLNLICKQLQKCNVSELETNHEKMLTTYESLTILKDKYAFNEIAFVLGADNLTKLNSWSLFKNLIKEFKIIVFRRNDIDIDEIVQKEFYEFQDRFIILDSFGEMNVSSSLYRDNDENEHLVLESVSQYIKKNHLYGRKI